MFEAAELGRTIPKDEYQARVPALRDELLQVQRELSAARFPVIVVFAGVDGAGKGETVNLLHEWMDPRWLLTHAYGPPSDEESERPEYWRFWRDLPPSGRIGLFLSSWYSRRILDRVYGRSRISGVRRPARSHRRVRTYALGRRRADCQVLDAPQEACPEEELRAPEGAADGVRGDEEGVTASAVTHLLGTRRLRTGPARPLAGPVQTRRRLARDRPP